MNTIIYLAFVELLAFTVVGVILITRYYWKPNTTTKTYPNLDRSKLTFGSLAEQSILDHERIFQIERRLNNAGIPK